MVWLHGGGWAAGDQRGGIATAAYRNWPAVLASLAARGYVVAAVSYRFTNEAKYPAQIQDVKAAVRWLRANAGAYGIDPNRVVGRGASAGGHLANLLGTTCNVPELEGKPDRGAETSSCVQGVVDFYGPSDMAQADAQKLPGPPSPLGVVAEVAPVYLGCDFKSCPPNQLRLANPIAFVKASDPPFLIMHGTNDHSVPPKAEPDPLRRPAKGRGQGSAGLCPKCRARLPGRERRPRQGNPGPGVRLPRRDDWGQACRLTPAQPRSGSEIVRRPDDLRPPIAVCVVNANRYRNYQLQFLSRRRTIRQSLHQTKGLSAMKVKIAWVAACALASAGLATVAVAQDRPAVSAPASTYKAPRNAIGQPDLVGVEQQRSTRWSGPPSTATGSSTPGGRRDRGRRRWPARRGKADRPEGDQHQARQECDIPGVPKGGAACGYNLAGPTRATWSCGSTASRAPR